jgi:hypothetical protein
MIFSNKLDLYWTRTLVLYYAECYHAKCRYAECRYAECRGTHILTAMSNDRETERRA